MKSSKSLLSCCLVVIFVTNSAVAVLKLDFHIESLCRFSSRLITTQFVPLYNSIKDKADIDFFVYGKSETIESSNGSISFTCQHGDWECEKNINMTCVLTFLGENTDLKAKFVGCAMDFNRSYPALDPECTRAVGVDQTLIDECAVSGVGRILQRKVGLISLPYINLSGHVPTVVFNGILNDFVQSFSQVDLGDTFRGVENGTYKLTTAT